MEEFTATIHSFKEVALKTYEVTFRLDSPLFFEAGQSIELCLAEAVSLDKREDCQKFSIVSSPSSNKLLTVAFLDTNSDFEGALLDLPVGSKITFRGPFGSLCLPQDNKEVVFIAGGIGVAPFMSMIQAHLDKNSNVPITLLYANANSNRAIYIQELEDIAKKSSDFKLKLIPGDLNIGSIRDSIESHVDKRWFVAGAFAFFFLAPFKIPGRGLTEAGVFFFGDDGHGCRTG